MLIPSPDKSSTAKVRTFLAPVVLQSVILAFAALLQLTVHEIIAYWK